WQDCRFRTGCSSNDIVLSTSSDGSNWTAPVGVPIDPVTSTVDHFIPALAIDPASSAAGFNLLLLSNCAMHRADLPTRGWIHFLPGWRKHLDCSDHYGRSDVTELAAEHFVGCDGRRLHCHCLLQWPRLWCICRGSR